MDREPAGVTDAEPRPAAARRQRRRRMAVVVVTVVLAAVVAVTVVLATGRVVISNASPAATPRPTATATASPSVSAIYQRVRPSVVVSRTNHDLGSGVATRQLSPARRDRLHHREARRVGPSRGDEAESRASPMRPPPTITRSGVIGPQANAAHARDYEKAAPSRERR